MEAGTQTISSIPERLGSVTEVDDVLPDQTEDTKPKAAKKPKAKADRETKLDAPKPIAGAVVGLPVQYSDMQGNVLPGRLQRTSRVDVSKWNVKVSIEGSGIEPVRFDVAFSAEPKPGCWNFLPKS